MQKLFSVGFWLVGFGRKREIRGFVFGRLELVGEILESDGLQHIP